MAKMTAQEKRWQHEDDVRTLRNYAHLQSDEARFKAATETLAKETAQVNAVLAMSDIVTMTAQEINTNWNAVQAALSKK